MPEIVLAEMSGFLPLALAGLGAMALIAVAALRRSGEAKAVAATPDGDDLLAQADEAAIAATLAATLAARRAQEQAAAAANESASKAPEAPDEPADAPPGENEIDWEEREDVYRPAPVDAAACALALCPERTPEIEPGQTWIFIRQSAYAQLREHLRQDLTVELGGLLYGEAFHDAGHAVYLLVIEVALSATEGIETPTSFAYTSASWEALAPRLQQLDAAWTLIGSYHSHPGLGVFLSQTDLDTQETIFAQDWQIAVVVDPVADELGFFVGKDGQPCPHWRILPGPELADAGS